MWDSEKAFNKVLTTVNKLNNFQWKHTHIFAGIKKHNPNLYDEVTRAQNEVDAAFTSKDKTRLDKALINFEATIGQVWQIYTGQKPDLKVG